MVGARGCPASAPGCVGVWPLRGVMDAIVSVAENLSSPAAEWAIVASMVTNPSCIGEVVGTQLAAEDFVRPDARALYGVTVESYFADLSVEPLTIAEKTRSVLAKLWDVPEPAVADALLDRLNDRDYGTGVLEHSGIVKRHSTARALLSVADRARASLGEGKISPEEVASTMSTEALAVTSGTVARTELYDWMTAGTEYAKYLRRLRLAREKGIELAVYCGLDCIDNYTHGIAPGEVLFLGGAPGVGKSAVAWTAAQGFAARQMTKPREHVISTLICSMEMGLVPSSTRIAQAISGIDGTRLREGDITDAEYGLFLREWKGREGLPLLFNYSSNFRLSQLRALIVEAIRRHNTGLVILDHFRQIDTDRFIKDTNDRDEAKVRFIKENLARDLNIAVICLAHTVKLPRGEKMPRPRLDDLRGSGMIAANVDFIALMHQPGANLSYEECVALSIAETDYEMIWAKDRHSSGGTAYFTFDPYLMTVSPR